MFTFPFTLGGPDLGEMMIPKGLADSRLINAINASLEKIEEAVGESARVQVADIEDFESALVELIQDEESALYAALVTFLADQLS